MGGLEVSNKSLRCEKCFEIRRMTIIPEYPEPKLKMECRCDDKETKLFEFLTEFKKKENFKVKCAKCQSENPKEPKYCYTCQKIYCVKCLEFHSQLSNLTGEQKEEENNNNDNNKSHIMNLIGHKVIGVEKVDFYCILHENEKFTGFCKQCLLNFCQKCQEENLHKDHEIALFSEILLDDKKKQIIKGCIALSHDKIDHNEKICKKVKKKIKNEENKNLITSLSKENKKINEKIIEYFETMFEMYEKLKHKNYSIIFNARRNTKFNKDCINFDKKEIEEEDAVTLIEYLKNDFILHTDYSLKKKGERKEADKIEKEEEHNIMVSINDIIDVKDNEKKKKEKEKEDDEMFRNMIKDDIIKEEEKKKEKKEEKKEEEKKEEEKKEEKKEEKIEEKKEEKKEETKKEKKEREKREKEEKARKEKEEKERLKKEEKEKKEHDKKEKEEKARKEKEEKEKVKKEEKEKKEHDKKEKEEKARKEKEEKERLKKEEKEKKEHDKKEKEEKAKKEKDEKEKTKKEEKKDDKKKEEKKDDKKIEKKGTENSKINEKAALFKQMMEAKGDGMLKRQAAYRPGPNTNRNSEPAIKIEHTRNEGNTVDLLSNIKVSKTVKKKPKKVNFE